MKVFTTINPMNVTYELSLLNSIVANQAKELELLRQQIEEMSTPKSHDYSKCWKTKDGKLLSYCEMTDYHLFCAIQKVWSTSPSLAPLLKEAQARWHSILIDETDKNRSCLEFSGDFRISDLLSIKYVFSPLRRRAILLAYKSLRQAGVDVALTI